MSKKTEDYDMRIALTVMADILILVTAVLAVHEYQGLARMKEFTEPYTDKLIAFGAIQKEKRESILREDRIGHLVGMALCVAVWIMLSLFFAGVSGWIAFPAGVILLLLALRPEKGETREARNRYYSAHKKDIDTLKYHEFLVSIGEAE